MIEPIGPEVITHQGKTIEVVTQKMLVDGREMTFERARRSPGTRLIILSNKGNILLTKEYRDEHKQDDYRLPGGKVFDSLSEYNEFLRSGEDILPKAAIAARKEAYEEVGIEVNDVHFFHISKCGATVEWDLIYFSVELSSEELGTQHLEHGENISRSWYTPQEALDVALNGGMSEDRSIAILLKYLHSMRFI